MLAAVCIGSGATASAAPAPPTRPNIVLILIDDMGWADSAVYGSTFYETPAIDRLAREGVRFSSFYAAGSVCSPTRASLMTGRYPARIGITDWIGGDDTALLQPPKNLDHLPLEQETIGEAFAAAGYATGYIGT
jgi:arylsulfatase A-like enzyme